MEWIYEEKTVEWIYKGKIETGKKNVQSQSWRFTKREEIDRERERERERVE